MFPSNKEHTDVVFFSVERRNVAKNVNAVRTDRMINYLEKHGIKYREVIGKFNGTLERSFKISRESWETDKLLRGIIFDQYDQDSVLHVSGSDRSARLEYSGGFFKYAGYLKTVPVSIAMNEHDNFTIDGNKAYIIE